MAAVNQNLPTMLEFHSRRTFLSSGRTAQSGSTDFIERVLYVEPATAGETVAGLMMGGIASDQTMQRPMADPVLASFYCTDCAPIESIDDDAILASPGTTFVADGKAGVDTVRVAINSAISMNAENPQGNIGNPRADPTAPRAGVWMRAVYRPAISDYNLSYAAPNSTLFDYLDYRSDPELKITPMSHGVWLDAVATISPLVAAATKSRVQLDGSSTTVPHVESINRISIKSMYRPRSPENTIAQMVGRINAAPMYIGGHGPYAPGTLRCDAPEVFVHNMPLGAVENVSGAFPPYFPGGQWYEIIWHFSFKPTFDFYWGNPGKPNTIHGPDWITWNREWCYPNARASGLIPGDVGWWNTMPWGYYTIFNTEKVAAIFGGGAGGARGLYLYDTAPGPAPGPMSNLFDPSAP
jgi:hypothetical protein